MQAKTEDVWQHSSEAYLPVFAVWLWHYEGPVEPLKKLLTAYFSSQLAKNQRDVFHGITRLMKEKPDSALSQVMFNCLEEQFIREPRLIDKQLLSHLVASYGNDPLDENRYQQGLVFLYHLGQQNITALLNAVVRF